MLLYYNSVDIINIFKEWDKGKHLKMHFTKSQNFGDTTNINNVIESAFVSLTDL